jgi:hypothetical protein
MMRRLIVLVTALALVCGFGLTAAAAGLHGVDPAYAAAGGQGNGQGVGSSSTGSTGQSRACDVHDSNPGQSVANGVSCNTPTGTFAVSFAPDPVYTDRCLVTFTGSGLSAGSPVQWSYDNLLWSNALDGSNNPISVAADGTLDSQGVFQQRSTMYFQTTSGNLLPYILGPYDLVSPGC